MLPRLARNSASSVSTSPVLGLWVGTTTTLARMGKTDPFPCLLSCLDWRVILGGWGWSNGSVVKSTWCSPRGPRFGSQHLHHGSQLSFSLYGHWTHVVHRHSCRQNIHIHKIEKKNTFKIESPLDIWASWHFWTALHIGWGFRSEKPGSGNLFTCLGSIHPTIRNSGMGEGEMEQHRKVWGGLGKHQMD